MIIMSLIVILAVVTVTVLLTSHRKDKYQQIVHTFFLRPPFGADPRGFGPWWSGDWFLGERVNNAIIAGKERYARKSSLSRRYRRRHSHR